MITKASDDLIINLLGAPSVSGLARTLAAQRLRRWRAKPLLDDALLIITELINNAVRETPNKEIRFHLMRDERDIVIAVWDSSPALPAPEPVVELNLDDLDLSEEHFDDNGGRGLHLVGALATSYGCTRDPSGGKWTWARLTRP